MYRACRRKFGEDKTDNEALRIFKLAMPMAYKLGCPRFVWPRGTEMPQETKDAFADMRVVEIPEDFKEKIICELKRLGDMAERDSWLQRVVDEAYGTMTDVLTGDVRRGELLYCLNDITPSMMLIRKLTPRECYRLMGVPEKDIDTLLSCGVSKSGSYKLAGNSIVAGTGRVDSNGNHDGVLFNIYRTMFIDVAENPKKENIQLSLFD